MVLLNHNSTPAEEEESSIPRGGQVDLPEEDENIDHPEEDENVDHHVDQDAGTILSLQRGKLYP